MSNTVQKHIEYLKTSQTICCTKPWTTLEERSVFGDFKVCCWLNIIIGRIDKNSERDIIDLWNCPEILSIRKLMLKGKLANICSSWCVLLGNRSDNFNRLEFWDYNPQEYNLLHRTFRENRERTIRAILEQKIEIETYPIRLHLFPSNTCNLDCRMCDINKTHKEEIGNNYFQNVYRLMPYLEDLSIFGGEPFACATTKKIVFGEEIRKYPQIHFSAVTNGTLLNDRIQEKLKGLRIGWIEFSLDSCNEDTYKHIRRGANFSKTVANLKSFVKRAQTGELSVKSIGASFVIQDINFKEIPDFIGFTHTLNVKPIFVLVSKSKELLGKIDEVKRSIEKGLNRAERLGSKYGIRELLRISNDLPRYKARERKEVFLDPIRKIMGSSRVTNFFSRHPDLKLIGKKLLRL